MANDALSALFDGELTGPELDRLLEEIERSPELGRQWSRLCATREAQGGTRIAQGQRCICSDVMGRLEAEPAQSEKVVDLAVRRAVGTGKGRIAALWKPALGLAAAASVGAAAVLLVQPAAQTGGGAPDQVAAGDFRTLPVANSDYRAVANGDYRAVDPMVADDAHAAMLREYLMDHNNAIGDEGVGGTLRYARFAAYKAEYRPQPDVAP